MEEEEEEEILGMVFSRVMASSRSERELGGRGAGDGIPELPGIIVLYLRLRVSFVILGQRKWVAMILSRYRILS